jgi:acyl-CoA thioesterase I
MLRISVVVLLLALSLLPVRAESLTLLALGDSLTAGLGLEASQAFPAQLEKALKAAGHDVAVINAGVSGDTALQGAERLDWALTDDVDGVLVELGANDALRGLPVDQAEAALEQILGKLLAKKLPVLLLGMKAPPNLGPEYVQAFDGMYVRLAQKYKVALYPFFLEGVAADTALNQADGIHPTAEGVAIIVGRLRAVVEVSMGLQKQ